MSSYGFNEEFTARCLETNRHNSATTTYYLLLKKKKRMGFNSHADVNSSNFDKMLTLNRRDGAKYATTKTPVLETRSSL